MGVRKWHSRLFHSLLKPCLSWTGALSSKVYLLALLARSLVFINSLLIPSLPKAWFVWTGRKLWQHNLFLQLDKFLYSKCSAANRKGGNMLRQDLRSKVDVLKQTSKLKNLFLRRHCCKWWNMPCKRIAVFRFTNAECFSWNFACIMPQASHHTH